MVGAQTRFFFFDGLKEHVTLADFQPDPAFPKVLAELGIEEDDILITMRAPGMWATYHRFENPLFDEAVTYLARLPKVKILLLPRYPFQADYYRGLHLDNLIIPTGVLDGLNLVYWSDMVISAGGSMNREAAVLGTPVWTIFAGKMAGVDQKMISNGIMNQITSPQDLQQVIPLKRSARPFRPVESEAVTQIVEAILTAKARMSAK
jgi:predicted glycosyltransferase